MKKILQTAVMGLFIMYFSTGISGAMQNRTNSVTSEFSNETSLSPSSRLSDRRAETKKAKALLKENKRALKISQANEMAQSHFNKNYKMITSPEWTLQKKAIVASYDYDSSRTYVVYNRTGKWLHTLNYVSGNLAPEDVKKQALRAFPNYDLSYVTKVQTPFTSFYILSMDNRSARIEVSLYQDEFNIIREFNKQQL